MEIICEQLYNLKGVVTCVCTCIDDHLFKAIFFNNMDYAPAANKIYDVREKKKKIAAQKSQFPKVKK